MDQPRDILTTSIKDLNESHLSESVDSEALHKNAQMTSTIKQIKPVL